jgi:hypothetical protein
MFPNGGENCRHSVVHYYKLECLWCFSAMGALGMRPTTVAMLLLLFSGRSAQAQTSVTPADATNPRNLPDITLDWRNVRNWGTLATCNGALDDSGAFKSAFSSLGVLGGVVLIDSTEKCIVNSNITIPAGGEIESTFGLRGTPGGNSSAPWNQLGGSITLASTATITLRSGAGINGALIQRSGITYQEPDATNFAGTAIICGGDDPYVVNSAIFGFNLAVECNGYQRLRFENNYWDDINGIDIQRSFDINRILHNHGWPFVTVAYASGRGGSTVPSTTLTTSGGINSSATSFAVASDSVFPAGGNYTIQVDGEYMLVTGGQGTTTWTVARGVWGSTATSHNRNSTIYLTTDIRPGTGLYLHNASASASVIDDWFTYGWNVGIHIQNDASDNITDPFFDYPSGPQIASSGPRVGVWLDTGAQNTRVAHCDAWQAGQGLYVSAGAGVLNQVYDFHVNDALDTSFSINSGTLNSDGLYSNAPHNYCAASGSPGSGIVWNINSISCTGGTWSGTSTTLTNSGGINSSATLLTVASAAAFPSSGNYPIQIDSEQVLVTAGQGTTTWTVTRRINGTTASPHSRNALIYLQNPDMNFTAAGSVINLNWPSYYSDRATGMGAGGPGLAIDKSLTVASGLVLPPSDAGKPIMLNGSGTINTIGGCVPGRRVTFIVVTSGVVFTNGTHGTAGNMLFNSGTNLTTSSPYSRVEFVCDRTNLYGG